MKANQLALIVKGLFKEEKICIEGESGFYCDDFREIKKIGCATNLSPETVEAAIDQDVDLIITHHDAWGFVYGMKDYCMEKLKAHQISHFYIHLPLDDADFGTNVSFLSQLPSRVIEKTSLDGVFYCGRIAELENPLDFSALVERVENVLGEKVKSWKNHNREIKRIGFLSGAGFMTDSVKEMVEKGCDVFITGEKILYTVQYAEFAKINLIVGSHTYTEIFGVEGLCNKIQERCPELEFIRLNEKHNE